jgi:hypothetical protein
MRRIGLVLAALSMTTACGGAAAPTAPGGSSPGNALTITCNAPTILAGDIVICRALPAPLGPPTAVAWTSSDPNVARSEGIGIFLGRQDGQATLTASYAGQSASAAVTVHLEDVLRVTGGAYPGTFTVGTPATLYLQGFYGVASADSGNLMLVVTDQTGATISTTAQTVPHGADRYVISNTFTLRPGTTRVCRTAVLRIGSTTFTVVPEASLVPCFGVTP